LTPIASIVIEVSPISRLTTPVDLATGREVADNARASAIWTVHPIEPFGLQVGGHNMKNIN
jgi:hypothetical protein